MNDRSKEGLTSLEALSQQTVNNALKDVHTVLPGIIDTFDPETQTCTVQPAIKRIFVGDEEQPLPLLINVPVCFPTAGGFSVTLPIAKGDDCLIMFSERSLDNWLAFGGVRKPADKRFHDLSDGVVLMGLRTNPKALVDYDPTNLVIRNEANDNRWILKADGSQQVDTSTLTVNGNVQINGDLDVDGYIHSTGTVTGDTDVVGGGISLKNHTHPITWTDPAGSGNSGAPNP